jgi:HEAT repeat protein
MKLPHHLPLLILASLALLAGRTSAHGGGYQGPPPPPPGHGPGPPPTAGPGGGAYGGPGDTTPGPHAGPAGPHTGGGGGAGTGSPHGPATGGGTTTGPGTPTGRAPSALPGGNPSTPGTGSALDATSWEQWWHFNKDSYLELKKHVLDGTPVTHGDSPDGNNDASSAAVLSLAVPTLERVLDKELNKDLVTGAMIALARLADGEVRVHAGEWSALFERFERDPNQEIAETSLVARGILGYEGAASGLADLMLDTPAGQKRIGGRGVPARTRAFAAYSLGLLGERASSEDLRRFVVHHLLRALPEIGPGASREKKPSPDLETAAVIAVGLVPLAWSGSWSGSSGALSGASSGAEVSTKHAAQTGGLTREAEIEHLLAILHNREEHGPARAHVPESLARLCAGAPDDVREATARALIEALTDSREKGEVASGCALALGRLGNAGRGAIDVAIRAALKREADEVDLQTRCFALIALGQTGGRAAPANQAQPGDDPDAGAREAQTFLLARLTGGRVRDRQWSALALGVLEHARIEDKHEASYSVRAILRETLLQAGSSDEVGALAIAEGLAGDRSCADVLLKKLERNADANTRGYVSVALGMIGAQEALGTLKKLLGESRYRPEILREVAIGLVLLDDPEVVPCLLKTLAETQGTAPLAAAAAALGFIGDTRTLGHLAKLCESQQVPTAARAFAAVALGTVGDRDRLPWSVSIARGINYRAITETLIDANGAGLLDML